MNSKTKLTLDADCVAGTAAPLATQLPTTPLPAITPIWFGSQQKKPLFRPSHNIQESSAQAGAAALTADRHGFASFRMSENLFRSKIRTQITYN